MFETAGTSLSSRVDATTADLLAAVVSSAGNVKMSGDLRVGEDSAAQLLGISRAHLKLLRQTGKAPMSYLRGVGGSRVSYRLADLAAWIESGREVLTPLHLG